MGCVGLSRRAFLKNLGVVGASLALSPWTRRAGAATGERVRIGLRRFSFSAWPVEFAAAGGLFREVGLLVEIVYFSDELAVARALAEGTVDAGVLTLPFFYAVHLGAADFLGKRRSLLTYQVALVNGSSLIVPKGSKVRYSRQFKDRTFGITTRFSMQALLLDIYLLQSGLVPGQDVKWKVAGSEILKKDFLAGKVDALALEEWLPSDLVRAGQARVMLPLHKLWIDHPSEVIAVGKDFGEKRSDALERLSRATLRAARELDRGNYGDLKGSHPPGSRRSTAWQIGLETSRAGFYPFPFLSAARVTLEELKKLKEAPADVDFKAVAEATCLTSLCRDQMKSAGFDTIPQEDSRDERLIGCCYTGF